MLIKQPVIAIDGPAGAGKSTVAKALAKELGLRYLDTGAMYRALALKGKNTGLTVADGEAIAKIGETTEISFGSGDPQRVLCDGIDVTAEIRTPEISEMASAISANSSVRRVLVARQKSLVAQGGVVLEGRDVTTVVAPDADVKVFLTASLEERARRRALELEQKGMSAQYEQVRREVDSRDHRDIHREDSPLTVAPDAQIVESGGLPVEQVVAKIKALIPGN